MAINPVEVPIKGKDATKPAFDSAVKNAESFAEKIKASLLNPMNVIQGAVIATVATIGSALIGAISGLARSSVESAASAAAAWGRVEAAVANAGASFDTQRGKLDRLFTSIQNTTRFSDDDAADAFATLVRVSGDYTSSLQNLTIVTDIAAAKKIDLATAAELVGKVMAGETGGLKKFGVVVREGEDAMDALRRQFTGFAERDSKTLEGQLAQIANAWDNVKEAIGRALTKIDGAGQQTNVLVQHLNDLGAWIDDNKADLTLIVDLLAKAVSLGATLEKYSFKTAAFLIDPNAAARRMMQPGKKTTVPEKVEFMSTADFARNADPEGRAQAERDAKTREENAKKAKAEAAKKAEEEQAKRIADLKHEYELIGSIGRLGIRQGQTAKEYELEKEHSMGRQLAIQRELLAIAGDKNQSLANRAAAADFVADRDAEQKKLEASLADIMSRPPKLSLTPSKLRVPITVKAGAGVPRFPGTGSTRGFGDDVADVFKNRLGGDDAFGGVEASLNSLDTRMKDFTGNTLANLFEAWGSGMDDIVHQHNVLGRVIPQIMRRAIAGSLQADAQDTLFRAAKAAILALKDPTGINALQAGKLFALGSAEMAAAAAMAGGGGRGGGGGGISAGGFSAAQSDIGGRGKVSVVLPRAKGSYSTEELEALAAALQELDASREIEFIYGTK